MFRSLRIGTKTPSENLALNCPVSYPRSHNIRLSHLQRFETKTTTMPLQATNPAAGFVGSDLAPPCLEWDRIYFLYRAVFPPRVLLLLAGAPIMLHQPQRAHSSTRSSYCLSHVRRIDRLRRAHCGKGAFLAFLPAPLLDGTFFHLLHHTLQHSERVRERQQESKESILST